MVSKIADIAREGVRNSEVNGTHVHCMCVCV